MTTRLRRAASRAALVCLPAVVVPLAPTSVGQAAPAGTTIPALAAGARATVMVSRTVHLNNQSVEVSWAGFRPSSSDVLSNGSGSYDTTTDNPVRVYQCRGSDPSSPSECYGSPGFGGIAPTGSDPGVPAVPGFTYAGQTDPHANNPDGPPNFQDTVTASNGSGSVTIQIFTKREAPSLGCDDTTSCSLVVVPNYGRSNGSGATEDELDAPWAWSNRTVVPLQLNPISTACPFADAPVSVEGSPAAARLLASWRIGACTSSTSRVAVDYTAIGEPQARQDVAAGFSTVGLTSRPLTAADGGRRDLGYAPVAVSGLVVAFQIDDAHGRQVSNLNLNARLVAKLITASYRVADDDNVVGNPSNIFHDPEFRALNPGVDWPLGSPGNHPILLADLSDLTWTLTRWLDHDKEARAFLDGTPDPHGMHVNLAYKRLALPVTTFPVLDQKQSDIFQPIQGLDQVSRQLSIAQFPGAVTEVDNGETVVIKPPRQNPGGRQVIGIVDSADAASFLLPVAKLQNTSGSFVGPTDAGMTAAISHQVVGSNGVTRDVDLSSKDRAIYPLTMVTNAVVPLHAGAKNGRAVARFLDYAAGPGQVSGDVLGQLPPGYLPLPKDLLALNRAASQAVLAPKPAAGDPHGSTGDGADGTGSSSGRLGGGGGNIDGGAGAGSLDGTAAGDVPGVGSAPGTTAGTPTAAPSPQLAAQRVAGLRTGVSGAMLLPALAVVGLLLLLIGGVAGGAGGRPRRSPLWARAGPAPRPPPPGGPGRPAARPPPRA